MLDEQGYLIVNRQHVGEEVEDFEYSPSTEYQYPFFKVYNEVDERATLKRFVDEIIR
jgi:DNA polymerase epsilon subunit 1